MGTSVPIKLAKVVDTQITRVYINSITTQQRETNMLNKDMTVDQIRAALREAEEQAYTVGDALLESKGDQWGACGFAWVNIWGIKGNTKLGRNLKAAGLRQDYTRAFCIWSPGYCGQNIDNKEAAARAYADTLKKYGFDATVGSRLD